MKIAGKISLSFFILIIIFASILTSVFYTIARDRLTDNIYSNMETIAQSRTEISSPGMVGRSSSRYFPIQI